MNKGAIRYIMFHI